MSIEAQAKLLAIQCRMYERYATVCGLNAFNQSRASEHREAYYGEDVFGQVGTELIGFAAEATALSMAGEPPLPTTDNLVVPKKCYVVLAERMFCTGSKEIAANIQFLLDNVEAGRALRLFESLRDAFKCENGKVGS